VSTSVSYAIRAIQSAPSEVQPAEKIAREPGVPAQVLLDVKHFMKDYGGHRLPAVTALGHGARPPLRVGRVPYPTSPGASCQIFLHRSSL